MPAVTSTRTVPIQSLVCSILFPCQGPVLFFRRVMPSFAPRKTTLPLLLETAKPPFAFAELAQSLLQGGGIEIGPALGSHPQLGIGYLPEQEIADAHLASGADQQIRVHHV